MREEQELQGRRVLLITADEGRRILARRLLARAGYRVQLAMSRREALHWLAWGGMGEGMVEDRGLDVILVDQQSLGNEARVVITAVRNAEIGVPTVVLSAFGAADDVIGCLRAGAADYISLPAEPREILDVLGRAVSTTTLT